MALERYGTLSLPEVMAPAIRFAEKGIVVTQGLARDLKRGQKRLARWPATQKVFFKSDGSLYEAGERLVQNDLANTLRQIADSGVSAFYTGEIADKIAAEMQQAGGLITRGDLAGYKAVERSPIKGTYRGYEIVSMPPPSSGGVHLIQLLNVLEGFPLKAMGSNSAATIHVMAEAMKFAFVDRSRFLGDPDYGADCTRGTGQAAVSPWPNTRTGVIWLCTAGGTAWQATSTVPLTYNSIPTSF